MGKPHCVELTLYCEYHPGQHRSKYVSGHTFIFSRVLFLSAADSEGTVGQGGKAINAQQRAPLTGPLYDGGGFTHCLTVEHSCGASIHHRLYWLHNNSRCT